MCTYNVDIKQLAAIRRQGHKLIPVYKYLSQGWISMNYLHTWTKGWNQAHIIYQSRNQTRTIPYSANYHVVHAFHACIKRRRSFRSYRRLQQTIWVYADEVTACDGKNITVSRAFIRRLNPFAK